MCSHLGLLIACIFKCKTPKLSRHFLLCRLLDAPSRDAGQAAPLTANGASGQLRPLPTFFLLLILLALSSSLGLCLYSTVDLLTEPSRLFNCVGGHKRNVRQVLQASFACVQQCWAGWHCTVSSSVRNNLQCKSGSIQATAGLELTLAGACSHVVHYPQESATCQSNEAPLTSQESKPHSTVYSWLQVLAAPAASVQHRRLLRSSLRRA